jgi:hypothetical protein
MVKVSMSDQDPVQAFETQPGLQNLALGAFTTIDQKAKFIMDDHLAGKPTVDGWGGCRSTEEDDFEQECLNIPVMESVGTVELYLIS